MAPFHASLIALTVIVAASSASAAELPSRKETSAAAHVKTCEINGKPGYVFPGSDICVKFSGYISGQVSAGSHTK